MPESRKFHNKSSDKVRFGTSILRNVLSEIDDVRGDTPRSWWLQRAALKELERMKQKKEEAEKLQGVSVATPTSQAANHNHEKYSSSGGFNGK